MADFLRPGARFRSLPFWGWNDRLSPPDLERQIADMKARGFGGFFIHSREGLETPYLGPEWMEAARSSVAKARELGLEAWIYDEDRWPSGFAGGRVPAMGDAFRAKGLSIELGGRGIPGDALAAYALRLAEGAISDALPSFRRLPLPGAGDAAAPSAAARDGALRDGETLAVLRREISAPSDWFNGESPPDTMNPDCVDAFLASTHEKYKAALGGELRGLVGGFFYDEPGIHDRHAAMTTGRGWIPWTDAFPAFYASRRGADFFDSAPLIFFDGEGAAAARHDYWRTVTERFSESFSARIGDWCRRNGTASTGHFLWEGDLGVATRVSGAVMPNYRHQDMPGIDILGLSDAEILTVKQCASAANQLGKDSLISELYGCSGWDLSYEDQKRQGDWQYALGVTRRCQHQVLASLRGCRKRDYPPSFNYHSAWWEGIDQVEDYFARISAAVEGGLAIRDILVLHPASTAWARLGSSPRGFARRGLDRDLPGLMAYGERLNGLLRILVRAHRDCDLGDELIMADEASIRNAYPYLRERPELRVGRASYKIVVLPELDTLLPASLRLLQSFAAQGGLVAVLGRPPGLVEGRPSAEAERFFSSDSVLRAADAASLLALLDDVLPRSLGIAEAEGGDAGAEAADIWCLFKDFGDCRLLFAVNRDAETAKTAIATAAFPEAWSSSAGGLALEELDLYAGGILPREAESPAPGLLRFPLVLGPSGSRAFLFFPARSEPAPPLSAPGRILRLGEDPGIPLLELPLIGARRTMPNALVLDRASVRIGAEGPWSEETDLWRAQALAREGLGMRPIWKNELPQRYAWIGLPHPRDGRAVYFRFRFDAADEIPGSFALAVEALGDIIRVSLNGRELPPRRELWYLDKAMETMRLPPPRPGANELILGFAYREASEVEDCALIGDFRVDGERRLAAESGFLAPGDWCLQGYPHYPGSMVYSFGAELAPGPGERYWLEAGALSASTAAFRVNGAPAGSFPWRDLRAVEMTELLRRGYNRIEIEVVGSPRNFLGPFHRAGGAPSTVDWSAFRPEESAGPRDYSLVPYGLFGHPRILRARTAGGPGRAKGNGEGRALP